MEETVVDVVHLNLGQFESLTVFYAGQNLFLGRTGTG